VLQGSLVVAAIVALFGILGISANPAPLAPTAMLMLAFLFKGLWYLAFVVWFRRANRALAERKVELAFGHHAWLWDFAPIMNLYRPYQVLRDIYEWVTMGSVIELGLWWGLTLAAGLATPRSWDKPLSPLQTTLTLCLMAAADLVLFFIVRRFVHRLATPIPIQPLEPLAEVSTTMFDGFRS
jgi:hypothetical protein